MLDFDDSMYQSQSSGHGLGPGYCLARASRKAQADAQIKPESLLPFGWGRAAPEVMDQADCEARRQAMKLVNEVRRQARKFLGSVYCAAVDKLVQMPPPSTSTWPYKEELASAWQMREPARMRAAVPQAPWSMVNAKTRRAAFKAQTTPLPEPVKWLQASPPGPRQLILRLEHAEEAAADDGPRRERREAARAHRGHPRDAAGDEM